MGQYYRITTVCLSFLIIFAANIEAKDNAPSHTPRVKPLPSAQLQPVLATLAGNGQDASVWCLAYEILIDEEVPLPLREKALACFIQKQCTPVIREALLTNNRKIIMMAAEYVGTMKDKDSVAFLADAIDKLYLYADKGGDIREMGGDSLVRTETLYRLMDAAECVLDGKEMPKRKTNLSFKERKKWIAELSTVRIATSLKKLNSNIKDNNIDGVRKRTLTNSSHQKHVRPAPKS